MRATVSSGSQSRSAWASTWTRTRSCTSSWRHAMSADPERRGAWAKFFEDQDMRTIRCAGPKATTCALEIGSRCPLHENADLIFYDEDGVTPELEEQLDLAVLTTPVAYASSMRSPEGREYPATERVRPPVRRGLPPR